MLIDFVSLPCRKEQSEHHTNNAVFNPPILKHRDFCSDHSCTHLPYALWYLFPSKGMGASYSTSNLLATNSFPPQGLSPRRLLVTAGFVWVSESLPKLEPQFSVLWGTYQPLCHPSLPQMLLWEWVILRKLHFRAQEEHINATDHYMSFHPQDTLWGLLIFKIWYYE